MIELILKMKNQVNYPGFNNKLYIRLQCEAKGKFRIHLVCGHTFLYFSDE